MCCRSQLPSPALNVFSKQTQAFAPVSQRFSGQLQRTRVFRIVDELQVFRSVPYGTVDARDGGMKFAC